MGTMPLGAVVLMTMVVAFGPPAVVMADHLSAPTGLVYSLVDRDGHGTNDTIAAEWNAVNGATKYSVHVIAGYDTDGDGAVDATVEFDFSNKSAFGLPIRQCACPIANVFGKKEARVFLVRPQCCWPEFPDIKFRITRKMPERHL